MGHINLEVGETFTFTKTFTDADIVLFSGISGDFFDLHINDTYAKNSPYGRRVVYGVMTFSLASTVSGYAAKKGAKSSAAIGYDKLRFLKAVYPGDTITATYVITEKNEERMRTKATCVMTNQDGDEVLSCEHLLKFFE